MTTVDDCRLLDIPSFRDDRGILTVAEGEEVVPFKIARVFWLHGVADGRSRGAHAHKRLRQMLTCPHGALTVHLDDGRQRRTVRLDRPDQGLLVEPLVWAEERDFSPDAVLMVLASQPFDEDDYVRDYDEFLAEVGP